MAKSTRLSKTPGVKLGSLVMDKITGFKGIAVGRTEFGYGCVHIRVQAQQLAPDGSPLPVQTFDDQRVDVLAPPEKNLKALNKSAIHLGYIVRDMITGAVGTVIAITAELDGRVSLVLEQTGLTDRGEPKSAMLVRAELVEIVERSSLVVSESSVSSSGGPMARLSPSA